jgi:16S rRNA (guanine527-N7)-methyltransferase
MTAPDMNPDRDAAAVSRPLTPYQTRLLQAFARLLAAATRTTNLTAIREPDDIERRPIAESLALLCLLERGGIVPPEAAVLDLGSGGGLPGIPLAVARPDLRLTLLEATGKKAAFLEQAVKQLALARVQVIAARAETFAHDAGARERYDLVVARAVAPLDTLVELALPLVRIGGWLAAVKGSRVQEEVAAAVGAIKQCGGGHPRIDPLTDASEGPLSVVLIAKVAPSPAHLPRRPGMPAKRPLR